MIYLNEFLNLPHRSFFQIIDLKEIALGLKRNLQSVDVAHTVVYLAHSEPHLFALSFLALLDLGAHPVCLSSALNIPEDSLSFVEGEWINQKSRKASPINCAGYSVPTSGSTGNPKLCTFELSCAFENAIAHARGFGLDVKKDPITIQGEDSPIEIVQTLPVHHSYGVMAYILTPLVQKIGVNFCPGMVGVRRFKKDTSAKNAILHLSPSQCRFILRDKVTAPQIQKITIGGGTVSIGELTKMQELFADAQIYVSYGLTEAGPRVTAGLFDLQMQQRLALKGDETWIGQPLQNIKIKTIENNNDLIGRLCIQSPSLKKNLSPDELFDGWLLTRDEVKLIPNERSDWDVFFISRSDDLLKYGGITIYPQDIENVVRGWGDVQDAIVLKEADPIYGDKPYLFIEGQIHLELALKLLEQQVPQAHLFAEVHVVHRFPRKSLEKVDRAQLFSLIKKENS